MRNLLIIVLAAAVVWLWIERDRLVDEAATANAEVASMEKRAQEAEKQLLSANPARPGAVVPAPRRESWLNPHLEKGAKALNNPQGEKGLR